MAAARALPGVYFAPPEPRAQAGLPALDVAAFVGLTERGPLHWPVAVEDLATYRAIFGSALAVARDHLGRPMDAHLPGCVEAFFANGGRRCHVVRVAAPGASQAGFRLPGLIGLRTDGARELPRLAAAWPGTWANDLRLGAGLVTLGLPPAAFGPGPDPDSLAWDSGGAPTALAVGDLLRITWDDRSYLFPIRAIEVPESDSATESLVLLRGPGFWPLVQAAADLPVQVTLSRIGQGDAWSGSVGDELDGGRGRIRVDILAEDAGRLLRGDILELRAGAGSWLLPVEELRPPVRDAAPWRVLASVALSPLPASVALTSPATPSHVQRLRMDLRLRLAGEPRTLTDLAFNPGHPRFFGDALLRESAPPASRSGGSSPVGTQLDNAASARIYFKLQPTDQAIQSPSQVDFPRIDPIRDGIPDTATLAGLLAPLAPPPGVWFVPLGMPADLDDDRLPERFGDDGLSRFDAASAAWFLEPDLVRDLTRLAAADPDHPPAYPGTDALMADAFDLVYRQGRRLRGLHGLLAVDEVALISVPDAVQPGWPAPAVTGSEQGAETPIAETPAALPDGFLACATAVRIDRVQPDFGPHAGGTLVRISGQGLVPGATRVTFGEVPASEVRVGDDQTLSCRTPPAVQAGTVQVSVEVPTGAAVLSVGFRYETRATDALPQARGPADFDLARSPLLAVQRELVRLCLGRADAVGLLSLPMHFEKRQCLDWLERIRGLLGWSSHGDLPDELGTAADLSYAAVYHPWPIQRDPNGPTGYRVTPPDGAVLGMIAASERQRQAWAAPANIPLRQPLGLAPEIGPSDAGELLARRLNLIRPGPRGFSVAAARTLGADRNLTQLSVRRLLILLRRTLAAAGAQLVFQANTKRLQGRLRLALDDLLRSFFDLGALAGSSYGQAFQVDVSGARADLGQLIVEVRIAPSRPVEFITVRMVRAGDGNLQISEG